MPAIAPVAPKAGPKLAPATPRSVPAARASSAVTPISKAPVAGPVRAPTLPAFARTAGPTRPLAALPSRTERMGAGQPLAPHVQEAIERSFQVDMSPVRVHTGALAETHAEQLSARAFAHGNDIFLGRGEHPGDVQLLAHEAAHVVQQQSGTAHQRWSDDRGDRYEREADRAAAAVQRGESFAVQERVSGPRVQRSILGDALDWIADKANIIPGFRMFTIVLGVNPVNMSAVKADGPTFLKAILEMIPGGGLIVQALDSSGIFEKVAAWMSAKIKTLGMVGSSIYDALKKFLDSLGLRDLVNMGGAWDRAKKIFTDPIERLLNFATGLAKDIIDFVRTAILAPLAKLAEGTKGYPLLKAVLGHDPVTGEPVPDDTSALISGILTLAGQEEVWENIKKANALARISAWFKTAKSELVGMVMQIPAMVIGTIKSLEIMDLIVLPRAIVKVVKVFGGFVGNFIGWAGHTVWNLLEIVFDVVSPGAWSYIKKTGAALKSILKNPLPFVHNLVSAAKLGFDNFTSNIGTHLKTGLLDWLTGSLQGVYIPKALTLGELGMLAMSVLGITWAQIRGKIVKALGANGESIMKGLETGFDVVVALVKGGVKAAWELIKEKLTDLKDTVISGITSFVIDSIVHKAIPKIIAMFIPGAGFISAIISIYDTVKVFVDKLAKIIAVVKSFVDSIVAIAAGQIGGAAKRVEGALAGGLSLAISFLAGFLGLGNIAEKILGVIEKIRASVDKALDAVIGWLVEKAKGLFGKLFGKRDKDAKQDERTDEQKLFDMKAAVDDVEKIIANKTASQGEKKKALDQAKKTYRLTNIELIRDASSAAKENVHVHATINPTYNGAGIVTNSWPPEPTVVIEAIIGIPIKRSKSKGMENVLAPRPGYERAHLFGPGFGADMPQGVFYAPSVVNQELQNQGIENLIREMYKKHYPGAEFKVVLTASPHPGTEDLASVNYKLYGHFSQEPWAFIFEYTIRVGMGASPTIKVLAGEPVDMAELHRYSSGAAAMLGRKVADQ